MELFQRFADFNETRGEPLGRDFYTPSDVLEVARKLLGKVIVTESCTKTSGVIVEVEAYKAPEDKASHAYGNKRTKRTEVMFHEGGLAYVYLCYGIHHMFNVVSGAEGEAHAILVRALEPLEGIDVMLERRRMSRPEYRMTSGPGSLSMAMDIKTSLYGRKLWKDQELWIEDRGIDLEEADVLATPRIGVDYAGDWARRPWRFIVRNSPWVSGR